MRISTGIVMALTAACVLGMQGQSGAATDRGAIGAATGSVSEDLARRAAMPEAAHGMFVPVTTKTFSYERAYAGKDTTDLVGYTFRAVGRGYSGNIETVVGVDLAGRITGTEVVAHKETPGTGGKIVEVKPAKSVLDVLRPNGTAFAARKVAIDLGGPWKGVVEITDADAAGRLEQALAAGDTSLVIQEAGAALRLVGAQCLPENRGLAYAIAGAAVRELRREPVPWWQAQFIGKRQVDLVLTKQKGSPGIQAITGATVSTRAVTESIKNGMIQLEQAVGGFRAPKEAKP